MYGRIDNGLQYESGLPDSHPFAAEPGNFGESRIGRRFSTLAHHNDLLRAFMSLP